VSRFPVTMGVTADGASPKGTVTANPLDVGSLGQCDDHDAYDDDLQRFSLRVALSLNRSALVNHSFE
jgi:hypothetical protein